MTWTQGKATREQTKAHNKRLVLKTIYDNGELSRAEIARRTHLARATVSSVVVELFNEGLVQEVGLQTSRGGKPGTLLSVLEDSRCLIGVDLADNEFRGGVIDIRGNVKHQLGLRLGNRCGEEALELVFELIDQLAGKVGGPILGIGVGVPGLVDTCEGAIIHTVHQAWSALPLRELLEQRFGVPVYVANDSQVAALGEYMFGHVGEPKIPNLIVLRVGPGVSAGIILNGNVLFGDGYGAGEIGHVRVVEDGELCLCGHYGCLETVVSRRTLLALAQELVRTDPDSKLHRAATPSDIRSTDVVLQAFEAGDLALQTIVNDMGRHLGLAAANLVGTLNIQRILIAGSISRFGLALLQPMREEMERSAHVMLTKNTEVEMAILGRNIVIQGAAALVLSYELGL